MTFRNASNPPILFITGTDTGIGKTTVTKFLAEELRRQGVRVGTSKPIESGSEVSADGRLVAADAETLSTPESPCQVFYRFAEPLAPQAAAELHGQIIDREALVCQIRELATQFDLLCIEGAGGLLVPIGQEFTYADLIIDLEATVLLVVGSKLGAINHAALSFQALRRMYVPCLGYVLNHHVPLERTLARSNRQLIAEAAARSGISEKAVLENGIKTPLSSETSEGTSDFSALARGVIEYFRLNL